MTNCGPAAVTLWKYLVVKFTNRTAMPLLSMCTACYTQYHTHSTHMEENAYFGPCFNGSVTIVSFTGLFQRTPIDLRLRSQQLTGTRIGHAHGSTLDLQEKNQMGILQFPASGHTRRSHPQLFYNCL